MGHPCELFPSLPVYTTFSTLMASPFSPYLHKQDKEELSYFAEHPLMHYCGLCGVNGLKLNSVIFQVSETKLTFKCPTFEHLTQCFLCVSTLEATSHPQITTTVKSS